MLIKILFTLVVIIIVAMSFRTKTEKRHPPTPATQKSAAAKSSQEDKTKEKKSLPTRNVAYILLAVLVAISLLVFVFNYHEQNRVVNIQVTSDSGEVVNYQSRHKTIKGRQFTTLDGKLITLGENDRIEMSE